MPQLPLSSAPQSLCILRLSAIGDICHTLPVVRTLQRAWPQTQLTWIIGKTEHQLIGDIENIEFLVFDKSRPWQSYRSLYRQLRRRHFDALLHMQMSIRSSLINRFVHSPIRLGFHRQQAKDLQWLFNNHQIAAANKQHVMDSLFGFAQALGIKEPYLHWDIPIAKPEQDHVAQLLSAARPDQPLLLISPSSSMPYRNWHVAGYAAICDYAAQRYGAYVVLSGGPSPLEQQLGADIEAQAKHKPLNLIGKTNLKQMLALLQRATALLSPDSGPAHMATAVNTPVVGLYACTNPDRARPYLSEDTTVNRYAEAIEKKFGVAVDQIPWGTRVKDPGTMDLISIEDVKQKLDSILGSAS
ncbi:MAG: glycosyltransferase family 9 protein [Gammaproteobacteria bacterium]|nr:glycosyltransferase family 9 protein [Gammaproteobacteria bacterium]MDH5801759.1 glycosyltransferase family 9 protein [Gammaproteobacteria bacterium]